MGCGKSKNSIYMTEDPLAKNVEGETITHVNFYHQNTEKYIKECENDTMIGEITKAMLKFPKLECLGYRKPLNENEVEGKFSWFKYSEVNQMASNLSENLEYLKLFDQKTFDDETGTWKITGIFSRNCAEWVITDLACQMTDVTSVTFYATLGPDSFDHIFRQTQISTIFLSPDNIPKFIEYHKKYHFESIKNVVIFELTVFLNKEKNEAKGLEELGMNVYFFKDLIKSQSKEKILLTPARPNSIMTLCYTSGTTSYPKGAMLTQNGFASQKYMIPDSSLNLNETDVILSYLPLAHVLERLNVLIGLTQGVRFGFISGTDIKKWLMEDLPLLKPTIFVTVPRILVNFHQKVMEGFEKLTGCKKSTAFSGLETKRKNYEKDLDLHHWYYDSLVFGKVKEKFGGKLRCIISGSAPLPADICRDIKLLLSCPLLEGYGMTELTGASSATSINDHTNLNVGGIIRVMKLKLVDKNELNYNSKTEFEGYPAPTGEICYYGPCVFRGYFRDPVNTAETIDKEGWLHTGDVGRIDNLNKGLKIIDRVKEIFKLSQGEYIAPSKLESLYIKSSYISQVCIYGNSEKAFIIAICVINKTNVAEFLVQSGVIEDKKDELGPYLENEKLQQAVKDSFEQIAKQNKLTSLEKPMKYILTNEDFTVQNEMLTPSMKLVRKKIQRHFQTQIDKVYL